MPFNRLSSCLDIPCFLHRPFHYLSFQLDCRPLTPPGVVPENPSKVPKGPDMCLAGSPGCPLGSEGAPQGPTRAWGRGPRPGPCCPRPQAQNGEVAGWRVSLGGAALPGEAGCKQQAPAFAPRTPQHPSSSPPVLPTIYPHQQALPMMPALLLPAVSFSSRPSQISLHSPISGVVWVRLSLRICGRILRRGERCGCRKAWRLAGSLKHLLLLLLLLLKHLLRQEYLSLAIHPPAHPQQ